jgi:AcrR family transcriptional regulator
MTNIPALAKKGRPNGRAARTAERRHAIVAAALAEFSEKGFAAARLEDVASRAGVAKGTIYLHFPDKRALFQGIVQEVIGPALAALESQAPEPGERARDYLERVMLPLAIGLATSPRREVIRLLIAEGTRFPDVAEVYYREIVERGLAMFRRVAEAARLAGEPGAEAIERFPQLVVAPALVGLIWNGLFERFEPLDLKGLIRTQLDLLLGPPSPEGPGS